MESVAQQKIRMTCEIEASVPVGLDEREAASYIGLPGGITIVDYEVLS